MYAFVTKFTFRLFYHTIRLNRHQDKAGDLYGADSPLLKSHILLGGHTASVITDLALSGGLIIF